jgi:phenylalanyl-tRNA synthetase beta chain
MNVSCNWLQKYVELPESTERLTSLLTESGLEIEAVDDAAKKFNNVVLGKVLTCVKHPNADKLSLCTVTDGTDEFPVVCGAPNVREGQTIAFARLGAHLSVAGFTIEKRKIRGELSQGMICSASELGLPGGHDGIMVFPDNAPIGTVLQDYLKLDDIILQIGITPNRGDALSHIGVARDISALTAKPLKVQSIPEPDKIAAPVQIEIEAPELCPRYSAAVIEGITISSSPEWMQQALESVGVRPINVIVDITNYVMMEYGQPMHAFDMDKIEGGKIIVRASVPDEEFVTLDSKSHKLPGSSILICDGKKPVALGGVMGGENSEIDEGTTNILLESAHFNPSAIRKTAKKLAINSEASYRFERFTDPDGTVIALNRAIQLILELTGGTYKGTTDAYPAPAAIPDVVLRYARIKKILGIEIPKDDVLRILGALGFGIKDQGDTVLCSPPGFRTEMDREIDIIEELARIYGYDKIPTPERITMNVSSRHDEDAFVDTIRQLGIGLGFNELMSPSLMSIEHAELFAPGKTISVMNPVNAERPAMRTSITPSLLEAIRLNLNNGVGNLQVFELGAIFKKASEGEETYVPGYNEYFTVGFALSGDASEREWHGDARAYDLFDLKGKIEALLQKLHIQQYDFLSSDKSSTLSANGLQVRINGKVAGQLVELTKETLIAFDVEQPVYVAELTLKDLREAATPITRFSPVPKYPVVFRDLAFVLSSSVPASKILNAIAQAKTKYLLHSKVVDLYRSDSLGKDMKSIAVSMSFQAPDKTLTDSDIDKEIQAITRIIESSLSAVLRST